MSIVAENRGQLLDTLLPLIRQMTSQEMWDTDETGLSQAAVFCGKKMVLKIEKENSTADQETICSPGCRESFRYPGCWHLNGKMEGIIS